MIPKVPPTDTFVVIAFSKQEKHIHKLNKIAETKIPKNQCQKASSLGGGGGGGGLQVVPIPHIWSRIVHNEKFAMARSEITADKNTALRWFAYDKDFQKIDKKKSYAQALCSTVASANLKIKTAENSAGEITQDNPSYTPKVNNRQVQHSASTDTSLAITKTVSHSFHQNVQNKKLQKNVTNVNGKEGVHVGVTGASPDGAVASVQNRFQPLQMLMVDGKSDEVLQDQQNDRHSVKKFANIQSTQPSTRPKLAFQANNSLVGKNKTGTLSKGIFEGC